MQKIILTIGEKDYPVESCAYSSHKSETMEPDTVSGIGLSLGMVECKSDLESVMVSGPFSCTLTTRDASGAILKQIMLEDAEITSYSLNVTEESIYESIFIGANVTQIEGRDVTVKSNF